MRDPSGDHTGAEYSMALGTTGPTSGICPSGPTRVGRPTQAAPVRKARQLPPAGAIRLDPDDALPAPAGVGDDGEGDRAVANPGGLDLDGFLSESDGHRGQVRGSIRRIAQRPSAGEW